MRGQLLALATFGYSRGVVINAVAVADGEKMAFELGPGADRGETVARITRLQRNLDRRLHCKDSILLPGIRFAYSSSNEPFTIIDAAGKFHTTSLWHHALYKILIVPEPSNGWEADKSSRIGDLSSSFPVYDIVGELCYVEILEVVE